MKTCSLLIALLMSGLFLFAQEAPGTAHPADSLEAKPLQEAVVKAYEQNRKLTEVAAPVSLVDKAAFTRFSNTSILPAMNANPGVRMEERSPGSYRLNIRGSTLRSPFGVRDIKIYWNEIPLTDPGGNTYLNELGFYNFQSIEIIKGTAGSLYGAGIGGAVLINSMPVSWQKGVTVDYGQGAYQTRSLNLNLRTGDEDHRSIISYSHQSSDGYRVQSGMRRDVASWETRIRAGDRQTIHAYVLYSDLYYQTPGALTQTEFNKDPSQARPATSTLPGAVQARAAIYQKNFTAGFSDQFRLSSNWQNTTAVYGAYTDFTNPGIRVYEVRQEPHFGGRTVFRYNSTIGGSELQVNAGAEAQKGFFDTRDYTNKSGVQDSLQTDDRIGNWTYTVFAQADLRMSHGWTLTGGASFNKSSVRITRTTLVPPVTATRDFENKIAPRIAVLKKLWQGISVYASASRGFSTPTVQELQKSNGLPGPALQPEDGTDYEIGARASLLNDRLFIDVNSFFFHLSNTIVQRIDTSGVSYSINAGNTSQHGLETYVSWLAVDDAHGFFRRIKPWVSHTWHDFHYRNFDQSGTDFSGKRLPGVPPQTVVAGLDILSSIGIYTNVTYTYADRIALNDANSAYAGSYNLLAARLGWRNEFGKKWKLDLYVAGDNLLNTKYSLGNDINAAAGRYYNAAPRANYFGGISLNFAF